ncbi:MAG: hypothetical protein AB7I19_10115 [Planctomycetota bacterium]
MRQAMDGLFRRQFGRRRLRSGEETAGLTEIRRRFESILDANAETAATRGGVEQVVFGWIETEATDLFGSVLRHERRSVCAIGISAAIPGVLVGAAGLCLCQRDFLPDLGDASAEHGPATFDRDLAGTVLGAQCAAVDGRYGLLDESLRPRDETRARAAELIGLLALEFAFLHDLQHVLGGHTDSGSSSNGQPTLVYPSRPSAWPTATAADRTLFELQADTWAMAALVRLLSRGHSLLLTAADFQTATIDPVRALVAAFALAQRVRHETRAADACAEGEALDHAHPLVHWLAVHRSVARNLGDDEPQLAQALHALEAEGVAHSEWLSQRFDRATSASRADDPTPLSAGESAQALCEAIRTRHPRLRWMHRLAIDA